MGTPTKRKTLSQNTKIVDEAGPEAKDYTPLQVHFIDFLKMLKSRRDSYLEDPAKEEGLLLLLDKSLYSAYRDCADSGVEEEAKVVLSGAKTDN